MPASASAPHSAVRTRLTAQAFGTADIAKNLAKTKIRGAKTECNMAMTFGPVLWPQSIDNGRPRGPAAPAFILRHNWAIWPRGEGHAVAVFCVEGPLRGRRFA